MRPTPLVSAAASGAGRQWRPFSADRSGNVDRFAAERHWRSLTPSRAQTKEIYVPSQAREGEYTLYSHSKGGDKAVSPAGSGAGRRWRLRGLPLSDSESETMYNQAPPRWAGAEKSPCFPLDKKGNGG